MADDSLKKLRLATRVYWILLIYIIAALVWWAILLVNQTKEIHELKKENLFAASARLSPEQYQNELQKINDQKARNILKYTGEGVIFLLLIVIGAIYIYRSVRRQINLHQQQQNFVMAITHELKTPIAASKLNLETLQKYQLEDSKKEKLLLMTLQETMRLDGLINNILISSQLEGKTYSITKEEINLSDLAKDVVTNFSSRYQNREVISYIDEEIELPGDAVLLKLLISNLLENAHKYSPVEKPIKIVLSKENAIELSIWDEGDGIAESEKKNVFKKFYRLGNEVTRKSSGTGLGLYLCKKIAEDHKGSISIRDNSPTGSIFIVQFS